MNTYFDRPDGELFVDVPRQHIPEADKWDGLSVNQLIEVKNTLTTRAFQYQNNPNILKSLHAGIQRLDALIAARLASS